MAQVQAWRAEHANPHDAYLQAIPKAVADSMAFEGEHVDQCFLEEHLAQSIRDVSTGA